MAIGLGCMRLSTAADRDAAVGTAVIAAALDAGITLFDTADAYAHDDTEIGHNERLLAAVTASRDVEIVTKGGLTRPAGAWAPDGRAKHIAAAARASRERLGRPIDLYLLHAVDPATPLSTSVRALAQVREAGIARRIGLSNVSLTQLEHALAITPIDAIEIELSPYKLDALRSGLVATCHARDIRVLAYRPLGGPPGLGRIGKDATFRAIAQAHDATPHEVALAWLSSLGVVPLPGATRPATVASIARAGRLALAPAARDALAAHLLDARPASAPTRSGEVVLIAGIPAAGKSTLATDFVRRGYLRLNRDERGGTLKGLAQVLDKELAAGADRVVLDNTYASRASRAQVIAVARRHGLVARCIVVDTSLEDAQANAVARLLARHGRLLMPGELARENEIDPRAQFRFRREWEPPRDDEGFTAIEVVPFARTTGTGRAPALLVELDDLVWRGRPRSAEAIELLPGAREALAAAAATHVIAGTTWQPGLADSAPLAARLAELLGIAIHVAHCAHPAGPPVCWCRKPMPGLGLALAHAHDLDLARSLHVGRGPADRGFALRVGVRYIDAKDGWSALRL